MSDKIGSVVATVGADASQFISEMKKAGDSSKNFGDVVGGVAKGLGVFGAAATAAGIGLATYLTKASLEEIDNQAKLARAVGASVTGFQSLAYAADLAGVNQQALAAASGKLNIKLGEAIQNGGKSAQAFNDLGVSVTALANMDADERMAVIADRIKELGMDSTTAGAALKALGMKSEEMRQFMLDGGDQIRSAKKELISFGVAVSDVDANKIEAANDSFTRLQLILKGVGNQMAIAVAPYIEEISKLLADAAKDSGGFRDEIRSAINSTIKFIGGLLDAIQQLRIFLLELSWDWDALTSTFTIWDGAIAGFLKRIDAIGGKPVKFQYLDDLEAKAAAVEDRLTAAAGKIEEIRNAKPASEKLSEFMASVEGSANSAAMDTVNERKKSTSLGNGISKQDIIDKEKLDKSKFDNSSLVNDLRYETSSIVRELETRKKIADEYRASDLGAEATAFAQKMAELDAQHKILMINENARYAEQLDLIEQRRQNDLARVAGDRDAIAAINAQYDQQEILAEELKQQAITESQQQSSNARQKLRDAERKNAISVAMGLGSQLMTVLQGHSKAGFEASKKVALASAGIEGTKSAISAWRSGMETGGPWAPLVAAAYTAHSLLQTGAMIQSIQSQNFNSGAQTSAPSAAGGAPIAAAAASAGPAGPTSVMRVEGINPNSLFSGTMVQNLAKELLAYQKDGGQVIWGGE